MRKKQKPETRELTSARPYPEGVCYVKVNEHETASTMAVLMRSLASQLDKYERDRPVKGMRFDREKRYFLIELQPNKEEAAHVKDDASQGGMQKVREAAH